MRLSKKCSTHSLSASLILSTDEFAFVVEVELTQLMGYNLAINGSGTILDCMQSSVTLPVVSD